MMNLPATFLMIAVTGASLATLARADESCCAKKPGATPAAAQEKMFLAEAQKMAMKSEGKMACCRSTVEKPVVKGEAGCCEAKGEPRLFKVFVAGEGYRFFGCESSAGKGRKEIVATGTKAGPIQKVIRKA